MSLYCYSETKNLFYRIDDEWLPLSEIRSTKKVKINSLKSESRTALLAELFDKKFESSKSSKSRKGRKTKPQPRSTAVS